MRSDRSLVAKKVPSLNESLAKGEKEEEGQAYCEKSSRSGGAISKTRTLPEEVFLSDEVVLSLWHRLHRKIDQQHQDNHCQNDTPEAVDNMDLPAHVWRCIGVVIHCVRPLQ